MTKIRNHMQIDWERESNTTPQVPVTETDLRTKSMFIGRVGLLFLSAGTGAWRVRQAMNRIADALDLTVTASVGLLSIDYSCFDGEDSATFSLSLVASGVNTRRLHRLAIFTERFPTEGRKESVGELHRELDAIESEKGLYSPLIHGLASAVACFGFTFLLGGGLLEMIGVFFGAGLGNFLRNLLIRSKKAMFVTIILPVAAAGLTYFLYLLLLAQFAGITKVSDGAFFCSMLFIIPGFPFITSCTDLAKQDMHSGLERLAYALLIILVGTLTGGTLAAILPLHPMTLTPMQMAASTQFLLRLITSFLGVYGFSLMFNSTQTMAITAAIIGSIANTLRLELVTFDIAAPAFAALAGALTAGLLASAVHNKLRIPRITLTVPSIVIMVPGLYFYRSIYSLIIHHYLESLSWASQGAMIFIALPIGLVLARIIADTEYRNIS